MSRDQGAVARDQEGLTVVDFVVMDVTERALGRVVGRMSHRTSVSFNVFGMYLFLSGLSGLSRGSGMQTRRKAVAVKWRGRIRFKKWSNIGDFNDVRTR